MTTIISSFSFEVTTAQDPRQEYSNWRSSALAVRRNWMEVLGMDPAEIDMHCSKDVVLDLDEELAEYNAACRLMGRSE